MVLSAGSCGFCLASRSCTLRRRVPMYRQKSFRKRLPFSRPPLERMLRIHRAIQAGKYPNATALAGELEVSTKSIYRDIEFMRDRLELPVEFDGARNGFHYTEIGRASCRERG